MPTNESIKVITKNKNLYLRVSKGHFATSHSHINYYIDVAMQKTRLSEAKAVAEELCSYFYHTTIVDTILCLDGTEVIATCLADELTKNQFHNINAHRTIYVITPEPTANSQLLFRDNIIPMIKELEVEQSDDKTILLKARICCQNPTLNPMQLHGAVVRYLPELTPDFAKNERIEIFDADGNVFR